MTRPRRECKCKGLSKGKGGETGGGSSRSEVPQAKVPITDIAAEVENDQRESAMKLAQAHGVSTKAIHTTLHRI
jgi:hypothetical protein